MLFVKRGLHTFSYVIPSSLCLWPFNVATCVQLPIESCQSPEFTWQDRYHKQVVAGNTVPRGGGNSRIRSYYQIFGWRAGGGGGGGGRCRLRNLKRGGSSGIFKKGRSNHLLGAICIEKKGGGGGLPGHPLDLAHPYWMATLRDISKIAKLRSGLRDNNIEILKSLY